MSKNIEKFIDEIGIYFGCAIIIDKYTKYIFK